MLLPSIQEILEFIKRYIDVIIKKLVLYNFQKYNEILFTPSILSDFA